MIFLWQDLNFVSYPPGCKSYYIILNIARLIEERMLSLNHKVYKTFLKVSLHEVNWFLRQQKTMLFYSQVRIPQMNICWSNKALEIAFSVGEK